MSNDIERLLAVAADDTGQPLHTDIDDILTRGRRSVRRTRIAAASTAVLTTLAIVGGFTVWSRTLNQAEDPAGRPGITIDARTGQVTETATGRKATPVPPINPLSDNEILDRCKGMDAQALKRRENQQMIPVQNERLVRLKDRAGVINSQWSVLVKTGDRKQATALFRSPDQSVVVACTANVSGAFAIDRVNTTEVPTESRHQQPEAVESGYRVPVAGVTRVLVDDPSRNGELFQARVGPEGYFALDTVSRLLGMMMGSSGRVRGYDADGKQLFELINRPKAPEVVGPDVKIKTADPVQPQTVLTKDPENGKPLTVVPESPLSDEQIRAGCKKADDSFFDGPGFGASPAPREGDQRPYDAGRISSDWKVALKVGSATRFTALMVAPSQNVVAWCYRAEGGAYDYTRSTVDADGTFGDPAREPFVQWATVPPGVAQIIVDLPTGPVLAKISNGYYLWGTTGGSENFKKVRVRGFDADGKKTYDTRLTVDAS